VSQRRPELFSHAVKSSRRHCRADIEERFTAARMVADYAELFSRIASGGP